jgi:hypothetical protein
MNRLVFALIVFSSHTAIGQPPFAANPNRPKATIDPSKPRVNGATTSPRSDSNPKRTNIIPPSKLDPITEKSGDIPTNGGGNGSIPIRVKEATVTLWISLRAHEDTEWGHDEPYARVNGTKFPELGEWEFGNDYTGEQYIGTYIIGQNSKGDLQINVCEADDGGTTGGHDTLGVITLLLLNQDGDVTAKFTGADYAKMLSKSKLGAAFTLTGSGANYTANVRMEVKDIGEIKNSGGLTKIRPFSAPVAPINGTRRPVRLKTEPIPSKK